MTNASPAFSNPQIVALQPEDTIDEFDEWSPEGSGVWYQAWEEDRGLTVAQVEEKARAQGEPGIYRWRGLR